MSLLLRRRGLLGVVDQGDKILVTITPTAGFTVSFYLVFTGSVFIDFKDGGGPESLTSGVAKTHLYAIAGTYVAEITGDLTSITQFVANSNRITFIENFKSGLLTNFQISSNLYSGVLDLSLAPISGFFATNNNLNLSGLIFASSGNGLVTTFNINTNSITGDLDLQSVPIGSNFQAHISTCDRILFATSGNTQCTTFRVNTNPNLYACDLSNVPTAGSFFANNCPMLLTIPFSATGNARFSAMHCYSGNFDYFDCTVGRDLNVNNAQVRLENNNMAAGDVNHFLVDFDNISSSGFTGRSINIAGTNAAPDGTSGGYDGLTAKANLIAKGFTVTTN